MIEGSALAAAKAAHTAITDALPGGLANSALGKKLQVKSLQEDPY